MLALKTVKYKPTIPPNSPMHFRKHCNLLSYIFISNLMHAKSISTFNLKSICDLLSARWASSINKFQVMK
jgi:hypothetical protein